MKPICPAGRISIAAFFCALSFILSCGGPPAAQPVKEAREILRQRVGFPGPSEPVFCRRDRICGSDVLPGFYRARDYGLAWIDDDLTLASVKAYLPALRSVAEDGLNPENYHLAALETLFGEIEAAERKRRFGVSPEALADLEMLLADSFLLCGSHLVHGQVNAETIQSEWFIKGRHEDLAAVLEKGLADKDIRLALDSLRPSHAVYQGLKKAYQEQKTIAEAGGWPPFPPGPDLKRGDRDARVLALRRSLAATGDLQAGEDGDASSFDSLLEEGLKAFQRRHGLRDDGAAGEGTAAALNVSGLERLIQLRANLERWRWITQDLGQKYILINIADFRVDAVEDSRKVLSMPAIVGTAYRRTPEFSAKLAYIEINPSWTVPPKLAREDILPKVKKNPDYLKEKSIRVFENWTEGAREIDPDEIDWSKVGSEGLSFKFRQDPSPGNSLGRIKFIFPNKFDVYIHDTPDRGLFSRNVRTFSSGCIRVQRPVDLAEFVLRTVPGWSRERIQAEMDGGKTRVVHVQDSLGVHLLYWTAWLDEDGRVNFREDVYGRDAAIYRALEQTASVSEN